MNPGNFTDVEQEEEVQSKYETKSVISQCLVLTLLAEEETSVF